MEGRREEEGRGGATVSFPGPIAIICSNRMGPGNEVTMCVVHNSAIFAVMITKCHSAVR